MIVEKKVWPKYFEKILSGDKNFEIRLNDFKVNKGDTLILKEFDPDKKEFTGREIKKEVTYIAKLPNLDKFWTKEELEQHGIQVIGFK
jgi:ASC-1-like (ASCH) protein